MPSDAKAKRAAKKAEKHAAAKVKAGATVSEVDAASVASTDTAASKHAAQTDVPAFFERTGKNAAARKTMNMDISVTDIQLWAGQVGGSQDGHAGGQELIDRAVLALTFGRNYGMVGRNGVGKTTILRAIACREIPIPEMFHVVHVEQECRGDDRTALETVVQVSGQEGATRKRTCSQAFVSGHPSAPANSHLPTLLVPITLGATPNCPPCPSNLHLRPQTRLTRSASTCSSWRRTWWTR